MKSVQPYVVTVLALVSAAAQAAIVVAVSGATPSRPVQVAGNALRTMTPPEWTPTAVWLGDAVAGLGVALVDRDHIVVVGSGDRIEMQLPTTARHESAGLGAAQVALAALGAPYRWGSAGGGRQGTAGFDCSGLIWRAFASQGIALPRVSRDQAQAGFRVRRALSALEPGDILAFSRVPGGPVEHVGLYVGAGRFVHSSGWDGGVVVSRLAPEDPRGRWWWRRWVGARRLGASL